MGAMERRTFLLGGAAALQAFAANETVNMAIVGVGSRGTEHVKQYLKLPSARVAALCDVDTAQMERVSQIVYDQTQKRPKNYQDLRKLYEDKDIDAVSIATPNHWHALATVWALEAGKDVYCEKPACYNIFEGQQMVKAARKNNRIVQIGMQGRSVVHKRKAIELVRGGAIGKAYMALTEQYGDKELQLICEYLERTSAVSERELARIVAGNRSRSAGLKEASR